MLELIPSLLAAQTFKQPISGEVQVDQTEVVVEKAAAALPVSSVAPPETISAQSLPSPQLVVVPPAASNVPMREITFNRAAKPDIQTSPPVEISQSIAPKAASQAPQSLPTVVVESKQTAQKLRQPSQKPSETAIASPVEIKVEANKFVEKPRNNPSLERPDQSIRSQRDQSADISVPSGVKPSAPIETLPELKEPSKSSRPVVSDHIRERQKVLEKRLAEIVSRGNSKKEAKLPESLVTRAYESAAQGKFEQARQSLKNPIVPAAVQAEVTKTIRSLEVNSRKIGVAQATEPIRTALKQRQMEQRQQSLLRSIPSLPPLPTRSVIVNSSPVYPSRSTPSPVQNLPKTASATSDPDYSVTSPPNLQAFNPNLTLPDTLGSAMLYPLPTPAPVTSRYGWRVHPVRGDRRFHAGIDLGAPQGTPVLATRSGKVKVADKMGGYGLAIVLEPDKGKQDILYAHLSGMFVRPGEVVKVGTVIGRVGSTGLSTGPHLHYETRKLTASGWVTTDPGPQLQVAKVQLEQALASARAAAKEKG